MTSTDSPIPYWISKLPIWPQLAQMALDIYSTPAMSDEPERVFSIAGNILTPRRRTLQSDIMQQIQCLRSWQHSGVITLGEQQLQQAVATAEAISIDEDLALSDYNDLPMQNDDVDDASYHGWHQGD